MKKQVIVKGNRVYFISNGKMVIFKTFAPELLATDPAMVEKASIKIVVGQASLPDVIKKHTGDLIDASSKQEEIAKAYEVAVARIAEDPDFPAAYDASSWELLDADSATQQYALDDEPVPSGDEGKPAPATEPVNPQPGDELKGNPEQQPGNPTPPVNPENPVPPQPPAMTSKFITRNEVIAVAAQLIATKLAENLTPSVEQLIQSVGTEMGIVLHGVFYSSAVSANFFMVEIKKDNLKGFALFSLHADGTMIIINTDRTDTPTVTSIMRGLTAYKLTANAKVLGYDNSMVDGILNILATKEEGGE